VRCRTCHYLLANLTPTESGGHRCPECGRAFDPNDPRTFDSGRWSPAARIALRIVIWIIVLAGLLTGVVAAYVYYAFSSAFRTYRP
jgi:hypothetical protein